MEIAAFILPVIVAGSAQLILTKTNVLAKLAIPLDGERTYRGKAIFGPNKTLRGALIMIAITPLATSLTDVILGQLALSSRIKIFTSLNPLLLGFVIGLAYIVGELPNSFFKRQLGIAPGVSSLRFSGIQYLVDQADSVIAVCLALVLVFHIPVLLAIRLFLIGTLVHILFDYAVQNLGLKKAMPESPLKGMTIMLLQILIWPVLYFLLKIVFRGKVKNNIILPKEAGARFVMAANHQSGLDPFMITASFRLRDIARLLPFRYMTANQHLYGRYGWLLRPLGGFPAYSHPRYLSGLSRAEYVLNKTHTICIFPEGRRSLSGEAKAKPGVSLLARNTKTYIIPLHIQWTKRSSWSRRVSITIGRPFRASDLSSQQILDRIYTLPVSAQTVRNPNQTSTEQWQNEVVETTR